MRGIPGIIEHTKRRVITFHYAKLFPATSALHSRAFWSLSRGYTTLKRARKAYRKFDSNWCRRNGITIKFVRRSTTIKFKDF